MGKIHDKFCEFFPLEPGQGIDYDSGEWNGFLAAWELFGPVENNVAAQAGDEPMLPHHPEPHTHTWSALEAEAIRKYGAACRAAGAAQVSPRATADVERLLAGLKERDRQLVEMGKTLNDMRCEIAALGELRLIVGKLIKAKGRFHTEQNYAAVLKAYDAAATKQGA